MAPWSAVRRTRSATSAVQPVWWQAPTPRPVSPWKYSWKGSRLRQSRWVWKRPGVAEDRAAAVLLVEDDRNQTAGEVVGQDGQGDPASIAGGVLDEDVVAEEPGVGVQRLDDEVADREPDPAAPVRVAAEQAGDGLVVDGVAGTGQVQRERLIGVAARQCPQAVRGEFAGPRRRPGWMGPLAILTC